MAEKSGWVTLTAATPIQQAAVRPRSVFRRVIISAIVLIVAVALVGVVAARQLAETESLGDAARTADLMAEALVQPAVTDELLTGDPAALAAMDTAVAHRILGLTVVRVKIWLPSGRIVYSDEARLIGETFELEDEELEVLETPRTIVEVSDLSAPENRYERGNVKLLEAYRPITTPSGSPMLFEAYFRYDEVTQRSGQIWQGFASVTLGSILLLVVLLLPVLWQLLNRLKASQAQREALLQRALDASAAERRRIAGTLHDGVVQELAGTSFALAAAAERAAAHGDDESAGELRATAGTVRSSIGGLRSLLVDIYPPSLATAGIAPALEDLAAGLRSRNISVRLQVADNLQLGPERERLVFRIAQECLTNAAKHASASEVSVRLSREGTTALLEISDDGDGFDAQWQLAHPADGHFGLRILTDIAADAGAELSLLTAPGAGTRWRMLVEIS